MKLEHGRTSGETEGKVEKKKLVGDSCRIVMSVLRVKTTSAAFRPPFFREARWLDGCGLVPRLHLFDSRIGEFVAQRNCRTGDNRRNDRTKETNRNSIHYVPSSRLDPIREHTCTELASDPPTEWRRVSKVFPTIFSAFNWNDGARLALRILYWINEFLQKYNLHNSVLMYLDKLPYFGKKHNSKNIFYPWMPLDLLKHFYNN